MYNILHKFKLLHYLGKNYLTQQFAPFKIAYFLVSKMNFSWRVKRRGQRVTLLVRNGMGLMNFIGNYEKWLDQILTKILNSHRGVFIDVGANTGQTLLKVVPHFPELPYHAFEPNSHCVQYLKALCEENDFSKVDIIPLALSSTKGETELLLRYADDILATTSPSFRQFTKYAIRQKVQVTTGDDWISETAIDAISLLKIDVEGGEFNVLKGFQHSIRKYKPIIICEILPLHSKSEEVKHFREESATGILNLLTQLDYVMYNIVNRSRVSTIGELSNSLESSNYLLLPANSKTINIETIL
ncbi:MAG: FkbM family methyltransferase [Cyclobacteriaceae bacterium]